MNYDMNFIKYLGNKKTSEILIYKISEVFWIEATTRFELVIRVLQTHALPLGYVAINDPNEIRTRVTAVKGRCLNRLTMGPYAFRLTLVRGFLSSLFLS